MEIWVALSILGSMVLGVLQAAGLVFIGYWMGRNSIDRPLRSEYNPGTTKRIPAEDEVAGDVFTDAMAQDEVETRTPTILSRRR